MNVVTHFYDNNESVDSYRQQELSPALDNVSILK